MPMLMRHSATRTLACLLPALALMSSLLPATVDAAQVYRWVDEKGQVHFDSNPPVDRLKQAQTYDIKVAPPATPAPRQDAPAAGQQGQPGQAEKDTEMKGSVSQKDAEKYCQQARDYKETLATDFSRRYTQPDGSTRPLTDEERTRENTKADNLMKKYCQPQ